jgi:hypothetical protein
MARRERHATAATGWQHHTIRVAISGALKKKVAQPSQVFLNQGSRNNPLAIRLRKLRRPDGRISRTRCAAPRKTTRPLLA